VKRTQILALGALAGLALLVLVLALRNPQPPVLPADADHLGVLDMEDCAGCHGPDGVLPRGKEHPLGADCTRCHGRP
jgi:hypothetical protein